MYAFLGRVSFNFGGTAVKSGSGAYNTSIGGYSRMGADAGMLGVLSLMYLVGEDKICKKITHTVWVISETMIVSSVFAS